ncbi:MAG TPA: preprotein translocase subunit SecY [Bryobacteraceae bacterium]
MTILQVVANAVRVPELRKRLLFTMGMLAVYRVGCQLPLPGIHLMRWAEYIRDHQDSLWGLANLFSAGSMSGMSVFALGITPYITASIMVQMMTAVMPSLANLQKEGELGRKKISQWTRYLTVVLAVAQSIGTAFLIQRTPGMALSPGLGFYLMTMVSLTAGSIFVMWMGEQITARGIGNGASLLIFTNILIGLPRALGDLYTNTFVTHEWSPLQLILVLAVMTLVVAFVVLVERGERRIPVQYAKRVLGRRVLGSQATHIPVKVNSAGVVPVIFASAILAVPQSLPWLSGVTFWRRGEPFYYLVFAAAVILFSFLYVSIIFNPYEAADNLRRYGGFIAGTRPGRETVRHFDAILTRLTMIGAAYLVLLCLIPDVMLFGVKLQHLWLVGDWMDTHLPRMLLDGMNVHFVFGGTTLLIVVGVAMDLINQVEAQLIMRHYETFTPRTRRRA